MANSIKTLAVVVTHNRCQLLKRCLFYLKKQTVPLDEIIVVNNASTDGTEEMLKEMRVNTINQPNLGSAGGWETGLNYALQNNYDAAWLMDDDGYPDLNALANLKKAFNNSVSCVSSIVLREDDPNKFVFPFPILNKRGLPVIWSIPRKIKFKNVLVLKSQDNKYPFAHFFNGALISINSVRKVGLVNKEFFIYGDEVDYFFRLREFGHVFSVTNAFHFHPDVSQRIFTPVKIYYILKNSIIIHRRYFDYVWIRNILLIFVVLFRAIKRNGIESIYSLLIGENRNCFYPAIIRGFKEKIGKDFNE